MPLDCIKCSELFPVYPQVMLHSLNLNSNEKGTSNVFVCTCLYRNSSEAWAQSCRIFQARRKQQQQFNEKALLLTFKIAPKLIYWPQKNRIWPSGHQMASYFADVTHSGINWAQHGSAFLSQLVMFQSQQKHANIELTYFDWEWIIPLLLELLLPGLRWSFFSRPSNGRCLCRIVSLDIYTQKWKPAASLQKVRIRLHNFVSHEQL